MLIQSCEIALHSHIQRLEEAKKLAQRFNLPLATGQGKGKFRLYLGPERLELQNLETSNIGPVYVDFITGRSRHRRLFGGGRGQTLARAAGIKRNRLPYIIDATAGFGRDAFVLATLGCRVTMIERSPVLAALLSDALHRAQMHTETADIASRLELRFADSRHFMASLQKEAYPDTLYLDPMYPHRNKSALAKKELQVAREVCGDDDDAADILEVALDMRFKRIAVKRPVNAGNLANHPPNSVISSRNTRYDIYLHS